MTAFLTVVGAIFAILVELGAVVLGGMRFKWPPVVNAMRHLNLRFFNPQQMKTAGTPGAFASVLRHTGRTSGTVYATPLGIESSDDGFVIAMVYGERTQWTRNVLASGRASIVKDGVSYDVDRPRVVPMADVIDLFLPSDRRLFSAFGVTECFRVDRAEALQSSHE